MLLRGLRASSCSSFRIRKTVKTCSKRPTCYHTHARHQKRVHGSTTRAAVPYHVGQLHCHWLRAQCPGKCASNSQKSLRFVGSTVLIGTRPGHMPDRCLALAGLSPLRTQRTTYVPTEGRCMGLALGVPYIGSNKCTPEVYDKMGMHAVPRIGPQ